MNLSGHLVYRYDSCVAVQSQESATKSSKLSTIGVKLTPQQSTSAKAFLNL
ncbi:hypothetical protein V2J09_021060 [Rumex salicifolius]